MISLLKEKWNAYLLLDALMIVLVGAAIFFGAVQFVVAAVPTGTIYFRANKDGADAALSFVVNVTFPDGHSSDVTINNTPQDFPGSPAGTYRINSVTAPLGVTFQNVNGSSLPFSLTLPAQSSIAFTFSFITVSLGTGTAKFSAAKDGISWDHHPFTINVTFPSFSGNTVVDSPQTISNLPTGAYTVNNVTPPSGVTFQNVNYSSLPYSQTLTNSSNLIVTVFPQSFSVGAPFTISVSGAAPNATLTIGCIDPNGAAVCADPTLYTTDSSGQWTHTYNNTAGWPTGTYQGWVTVNGVKSNIVTFTVAQSAGTIHVRATKDGLPWTSPSFTFNGTGPGGTFSNFTNYSYTLTAPQDSYNSMPGTYTVSSVNPPAGVTLQSVNGASLQYTFVLPSGGDVTVTFNFVTHVNSSIPIASMFPGNFTVGTSFTVSVSSAVPNGTVKVFCRDPNNNVCDDPTSYATNGSGNWTQTYNTTGWLTGLYQGWVTVNGVQSNIGTYTITPPGGTIHVRATKDGVSTGLQFTFNGSGPGGAFANYLLTAPQDSPNVMPGTYTVSSVNPPAGVTLKDVNGASLTYTFVLPSGGDVTVTFNFVTTTQQLGGTINFLFNFKTEVVQQPTLAISPTSASVNSGATQQFSAIYDPADGTGPRTVTATSWSSSNNSVASVDAAGTATGYSAGSATITAQYAGLIATAALTVTTPKTFSKLYGIGLDNAIYRWNGNNSSNFSTQWTRITDGSVKDDFILVNNSESDIYALGLDNQIWHWNGSWSRVSSGGQLKKRLWYANPNLIYGIGLDDRIWKWTGGSNWSQLPLSGWQARDFVLLAENDIYIIGLDYQIWHWNGTSWSAAQGGQLQKRLWYVNPNLIYGIGLDNQIWKWAGGSNWAPAAPGGQASDDFVMANNSANDIYIIGLDHQIWHWNGSAWEQASTVGQMQERLFINFVGVPTPSSSNVIGTHDGTDNASCTTFGWATDPDSPGTQLSVKLYSDGTLVKTVTAGQQRGDLAAAGVCPNGICAFNTSLSGLISTGVAHSITAKGVDVQTGGEVSLGGTPKSITCATVVSNVNSAPVAVAGISKDGSTYSPSITVTKGVATNLWLSAAGSYDPDGWTDATNGVSGGSGNSWTQIPGGHIRERLRYVSPNKLYGIGLDYRIYRIEGSNWTQITTNGHIKDDFIMINEGNIFAYGLDDGIWQWDGSSWSPLSSGGSITQRLVRAAGRFYGIGLDHRIWRWNGGSSWTNITNGLVKDDFILVNDDPDFIYGIGWDNQIWRWVNGTNNSLASSFGQLKDHLQFVFPRTMYGIGLDGNIWKTTLFCSSSFNDCWTRITSGVSLMDDFVLVNDSESDIYAIGTDNRIYHWGPSAGKCEWNTDLNQGTPTYEQTISNPASASACNVSLGSHTFNDPPGTYTYQVLRITDKPGAQSNVAAVNVTVEPLVLPLSVSCSVSPTSATTGQSVTWTATASGGTGSYSYLWSGNNPLDGKTGNLVTVAYSTAGTKTGSVSVNGGAPQACSASVNVTAAPIPPVPTSPSATTAPDNACKIINVSWTNSAGATGYNISRCSASCVSVAASWPSSPFKDTSASDGIAYTYQISACNAFGCSAPATTPSVTNNAPEVSFSYTPSSNIARNQLVKFAGALLGGNATTSQSWTFSGGNPSLSTSPSPSSSFATAGSHAISYTANNASGSCIVSDSVLVRQGIPGDWCELPPDAPPGTPCP